MIKTIEPLPVHLGDYGVIKIFYYKKECGERERSLCVFHLRKLLWGSLSTPWKTPRRSYLGTGVEVCAHTHTPALHFSEKSTKLDEDDRILENVFFFPPPPRKKGRRVLISVAIVNPIGLHLFKKRRRRKGSKGPVLAR